jgi:predicted RNase H-like HicB family nuclease
MEGTMPATYYPAIIDRSASGFGASFPDFPGVIANGATIGETCLQAEKALGMHLDAMVKDKDAIPAPSDLDAIEDIDGADDVARVMVRADVPAKVERVLVSIEANLLRAIDAVAQNRSAFLSDAARVHLNGIVAAAIDGQGELATMNRADLEMQYGLKRKRA